MRAHHGAGEVAAADGLADDGLADVSCGADHRNPLARVQLKHKFRDLIADIDLITPWQ